MSAVYDFDGPWRDVPAHVTYSVVIGCDRCKTLHEITMPLRGFLHYCAGALIQNALPGLSLDIRELILSGICGKCFDALIGPEEL